MTVYQAEAIPSRRQIDLPAIRRALSFVWLIEPVSGEATFRYRLAGEHVNAIFGCSLRGKRLTDILEPDLVHEERARFMHVLNTPGALYATSRLQFAGGGYHDGERLILPLSDDGVNGSHVLGVTDFGRGRRDEWKQPRKYQDERFLEIGDVLAWNKALGVRRRS